MTQQEVIADLERRASALDVSIAHVCELSGVHPTSFSRWKRSEQNDDPPSASMKKIEALYATIEHLEAQKKAA